jgi:hypothetical protein
LRPALRPDRPGCGRRRRRSIAGSGKSFPFAHVHIPSGAGGERRVVAVIGALVEDAAAEPEAVKVVVRTPGRTIRLKVDISLG